MANETSETLSEKMKKNQRPLRKYERTSNGNHSHSSSPSGSSSPSRSFGLKNHKSVKQLMFETVDVSEDEECDLRTSSSSSSSSTLKVKRMDARLYRTVCKKSSKDCHVESNRTDKSTVEGGDQGGSKIDECFKVNSVDSKAVSKDGVLPSEDAKAKDMSAESRLSEPVKEPLENNVTLGSSVPSNATTHETSVAPERVQSDCRGEETSQMLGSRNSVLNENLIRKCVGHDKVEKLISSKRKRTMEDMHSDISATLVDDDNNLIVDASLSRLCGNIVGTSGSCSKRIRRISLSDVQRDQRKLIRNVDLPSSKSNGEKLSTENKEERPQGNDVETEEIKKQQRSLHLSLKPEIARLCEILLLPNNVKIMVENCLEYIVNNYQICTEPVSILQAFQLSLCWTAASLLKHKLDFEASLRLAKQYLNFECSKDVVDEINSRLWDLKENFLFLTGNTKAVGYPKASEPSSRVYLSTEVTLEVELGQRDISKNFKEIQKHKKKWKKLLQMQQEEKQKLKKDMENEEADFKRRCTIEWAAIQSCSPNDVTRKEKLKVFNIEYDKRYGELKRQHEKRLKVLEAKQLAKRRKFQESWAPDENLVASRELGMPHNAPKALVSDNVSEGKSSDNTVEAMTRTRTGVGLSEVVGLCSRPVELQTPLVKHAGVNEMDIIALKDGSVSGNKCHNMAANEYDSQGNIISKHPNSRERCSDGATGLADEGEGFKNFSRESHNDSGQDTVPLVPLPSNGQICDGETSNVPSGEVTLAVHKTSSSNDDRVEIPSSGLEKLDEVILSKPVDGLSTEVKAHGFSDAVKNMASLNSQSLEENIPSVNTACMPNCKNAAQILEVDDSNGSNNADTLNSWNSKSPQEHVHSVKVTCMPNSEDSAQIHKDDGSNGSNNVVSLSIDERSADGTVLNVLDGELHVGMPGTVNFAPSSMEQISRTASSSNSPDANAIILLNQPSLEKHYPDGVSCSSTIPAGQNPVEMSETSHEGATVSELDREAAVVMPNPVNCTDYPKKATLNFSSMDQIRDGGSVLDGVLSSNPSTSSPSKDRSATTSLLNHTSSQPQVFDRALSTIPDEQIPVIVPEKSHGVAECQITDSMVMDKSTTSDRTMTENSVSQETPVSRSVDLIEPLEQVQPPSIDTTKEMQDSLVSIAVDIVPANQSNQTSLVMEPQGQVQHLPSAGFIPSNQDLSNLPSVTGIEDQANNEDSLSRHIPEASIVVQNHTVEQPASNLEVDSHSHRVVMHPASNLDLDSLMPGRVRTQYLDRRNPSAPEDINNHPIQTAVQSASRIVSPLCHDPLSYEMERMRKLTQQEMKNHEDMNLQLKCDFEKEVEELLRKYETNLNKIEVEFQKRKKNLDTQLNTVYLHKILADAFRSNSLDLKVSGASEMQQEASFVQQAFQLSRQQRSTWPSVVPSPSSCGPSAANLQSSYAIPGSQTMLPPTYNTSRNFSGIFARPPHINSISSSPSGNLQAGREIRAPAPHLQPHRPSTSVPDFGLCTVPHGMPTHHAPGNIPVTSSFSHSLHRPPHLLPTTFQSDPHRGHWPESAGGLPTPNISVMNLRPDANSQFGISLPNVVSRVSDFASLNLFKFGTSSMPANTPHQATSSDVVCLSDDD